MATIPLQVVFSRDPDTGTVSIHVDLQSVSAEKQPARTNPGRWITGALTLTAAAAAGSRLRRTRRPHGMSQAVAVLPQRTRITTPARTHTVGVREQP
jgi:hypothetical protein